MWEKVGIGLARMGKFFFSGSSSAKLDDKNRFVLPMDMRMGLVENGALEFTIALSIGGCLAIYRKSDIDKIVAKFQEKQHIAKYQKFFTLFFSTLFQTTCDKIGRVVLPSTLKNLVGIKSEMVIAGVMDKIEIWPKDVYDKNMQSILSGKDLDFSMQTMTEEAFALLHEEEEESCEK